MGEAVAVARATSDSTSQALRRSRTVGSIRDRATTRDGDPLRALVLGVACYLAHTDLRCEWLSRHVQGFATSTPTRTAHGASPPKRKAHRLLQHIYQIFV